MSAGIGKWFNETYSNSDAEGAVISCKEQYYLHNKFVLRHDYYKYDDEATR